MYKLQNGKGQNLPKSKNGQIRSGTATNVRNVFKFTKKKMIKTK
jgi:hypothetical protein